MDTKALIAARERLLAVALERFASDPNVVGVFLGGSLAADSADAYSDIDLRVVVRPESHADFIERRCEIPKYQSRMVLRRTNGACLFRPTA